jgi:hypothetical protein
MASEPSPTGPAAIAGAETEPVPGRDLVDRATTALDAAGVRWCRLRDRGSSLEEDLLVAGEDLPVARRALASTGFHERRHPGRGTHRAFIAYDEALDAWLKLDVVTDVAFGRWQEWPTDLEAGWLERRAPGPDGPRLAPDDAFWALLLHETLDRDTGVRRLDELRRLAASARPDGPGARVAAGPARDPIPSWIIEMAARGEASSTAILAMEVRRCFERRARVPTQVRRLRSRLIRRIDRRDPPFVRSGITVALLGPDGAGKSSLTTRIGAGGPIPVRSVYLGLYGGGRGGANGAGRRVRGLGTARRLLAMWRGGAIGWLQARRGRIVVYDRHPYDARLADGARGLGRLRRALLGRALPSPDVVVVLDAPAEVLVARKAEHPIERIEAQRRRYLDLAARLPGSTVVNVEGPIDEVARRVTSIVSAHLAARSDGPVTTRNAGRR